MRRAVFVAAATGIAAVSVVVGAQSPKQIQLFASVLDAAGAPVQTLANEDLRIMENGMEARITKVEPLNWPVKLQVLVDNGVGIGQQNLPQLKSGIEAMLDALPGDLEVTLVTTAPQPRFLARPTKDRAAVRKGLDLLASDSGAGRFVESLAEATQRIERDKTDFFPVIVTLATTSGDRDARDYDMQQILKRLEARPTTVHMVLFSGGPQGQSGGAVQTNLGLNMTKFTGGRFENINSATRIPSLLPEIGKQVATAVERQSRLFRLTIERPAGASGNPGSISAGARAGLQLASLSMDGRIR